VELINIIDKGENMARYVTKKHSCRGIFISVFKLAFLAIVIPAFFTLKGAEAENSSTENEKKTQIEKSEEDDIKNAENKSSKPYVWITFLPVSPILSISEISFTYHPDWIPEPKEYKQALFPQCDLEIRRLSDQKRMARVSIESNFSFSQLSQQTLRRIGQIPDGEYLAAFCIGDKRCSNVAQFTIESNFDPLKYKTLTLIPLEPAPGYEMKYLGLRTVGPTPTDYTLSNFMITYPNLIVDGVERHPMAIAWSGPIGPLPTGRVFANILIISNYGPQIEPGKKHAIKASAGNYESESIEIPLTSSLGQKWDNATKNLLPLPPQKAILEGQFIGTDGKTGKNYVVHLIDRNNRGYMEYTDENGKYTFFNIPSGRYRVQCDPNAKGLSSLVIETVTIDANKPKILNINMEKKYFITGTAVLEDGTAASGINVTFDCRDVNNTALLRDFTRTDENGKYRLGSPFGNVTSIGIAGGGSPRKIELKPGINELNFVLKKDSFGRYEGYIIEKQHEKNNYLSVKLMTDGNKNFEFGKYTQTSFVIKNISEKALVVTYIKFLSKSEDTIRLAGSAYGSVRKIDNQDGYSYNELNQQMTGMAFYAGFLLPGQEVTIQQSFRPVAFIESLDISYISSISNYDVTKESLKPFNPYIPEYIEGKMPNYYPFDEQKWFKLHQAYPKIETQVGPDAPKRTVLLPDLKQKEQHLTLTIPINYESKAFTLEEAQEAAGKISGLPVKDSNLVYSSALGGYVVIENSKSWILKDRDQRSQGTFYDNCPVSFFKDIDQIGTVRIRVGDKQEGFGPEEHPTKRKFWDTYPVYYGDGMYTTGEFINVNKDNMLSFLQRLTEDNRSLKEHYYFFGSRYFELVPN
jgi:hypothetical protein